MDDDLPLLRGKTAHPWPEVPEDRFQKLCAQIVTSFDMRSYDRDRGARSAFVTWWKPEEVRELCRLFTLQWIYTALGVVATPPMAPCETATRSVLDRFKRVSKVAAHDSPDRDPSAGGLGIGDDRGSTAQCVEGGLAVSIRSTSVMRVACGAYVS